MLGADGQPDGAGENPLLRLLLRGQLGVGGGGRVDDQALGVGYVGQQGEQLQVVQEAEGPLLSPFQVHSEDGAAAPGEIPPVQAVVRMVRERGVVDPLHLGVVGEILHHLPGVLGVAVQAEGQGLDPLEQEECVEGGDGSPGVPQQDGPDVGGQGGGAGGVREADPVVAGVGRPNGGEAAGGLPVKGSPVHDDPAQGGAVAP